MFHLTPQEEKVLRAAVLVLAVGTLVQIGLKKNARMVSWIKSGSLSVDQQINLNRADIKELETVPGIGPKTAAYIVEYRRQYGAFKDTTPLLKMRGMTPERYERLKSYLKV